VGATRRDGGARPRSTLAGLATLVACLFAPAAASAAEPVFHELPPGTHAYHLTAGPGDGIWFTGIQVGDLSDRAAVVGSVSRNGTVAVFRLPDGFAAGEVTAGPEGSLWFGGGYRNKRGYVVARIGRFSPADRTFTEFVPANRVGGVNSVAAGSDGAMWFTMVYWVNAHRRAAIGRIDASGAIAKFPLPGRSGPGAIVAGPDGNLWFTESGGGKPRIGRITPAGRLTHFRFPRGRWPTSIAAGPDGNLWFGEVTGGASVVGRITPAGAIRQLRVPARGSTLDVTPTPDGNVWFTAPIEGGPMGLGSIATTTACVKATPCETDVDALGVDDEGQLWFSTSRYYPHNGGGGTGLMEGMMEEAEAGFVGFAPSD
jgi:streptogramin lyase